MTKKRPLGHASEETLLHVYWSALNDARDKGRGHLLMRDKISVDLGIAHAPDPGFTAAEMQTIASAAKRAALQCLHARACNRNYAEGAHCARDKDHKGKCSQLKHVRGRIDE